ncbi:MAG: 1-phosphofructokinase [Miniphocaeibacter sp.]|uniref:1-phosphofructokinase n=1 Tax=Miniphocaeibacter sp. TaxID=3100973 RepID=UPI0018405A19|nr:1-phosphofructokinase [Gallicola sp.]
MIVTVTLNPSIDISYRLEEFLIDGVNRTNKVSKTPGGKGLNVTRVLKQLKADVLATGFLGGRTGEFLEDGLKELSINTKFLQVKGNTRNCIAILHEGKQTEILESGEEISKEEQEEFFRLFEKIIEKASVVTISGSVPPGIASDYYEELLKIASRNNIKVILDTSGNSLKNIVLNSEIKPYCIKPNETEIKQIEGKEINTKKELIEYLKSKIFNEIELVVVTMGGEGALVKYKDEFYNVEIPKIKVVNPVGSGDSTVAGIAYGLENNLNIEETIKYAMTCGILNTMEEKTGFINVNEVENIKNQVKVIKL